MQVEAFTDQDEILAASRHGRRRPAVPGQHADWTGVPPASVERRIQVERGHLHRRDEPRQQRDLPTPQTPRRGEPGAVLPTRSPLAMPLLLSGRTAILSAAANRRRFQYVSNHPSPHLHRYASSFEAIPIPCHLRLFFHHLSRVCEHAGQIEIASSTVSHHLRKPRQAWLIRLECRGRSVDCRIEPATLATLSGFFHEAGSD